MKRFNMLGIGLFCLLMSLVAGSPARAQIVVGTEDPANGFVGAIPLNAGSIGVASDGESPLRPFGIPVDVSDAINLDLVQDGFATGWQLVQGNWVQQPNTQIWYVDAAAVGENEPPPGAENPGVWENHTGGGWAANLLGEYRILDPAGGFDQIVIFNNPASGVASVYFNSDVPEPGTITLLGMGIAGLACYGWRRRKVAVQE